MLTCPSRPGHADAEAVGLVDVRDRSAGKTGTRKRISKTGLTWKKFLAAYDRGGRVRFFAASSRWRWLGGRRVTWAARVLDWGKS